LGRRRKKGTALSKSFGRKRRGFIPPIKGRNSEHKEERERLFAMVALPLYRRERERGEEGDSHLGLKKKGERRLGLRKKGP